MVHPPSDAGNTRDEVPMPPFHPNAMVPRPAPTLPSATGPPRADSMACTTSGGAMGRDRMALSVPSLVSPTTGLMDRTFSMPGWASIHATRASAVRQTHSVQVSRIGVSISPSSSTCVTPSSLPKPLPTKIAAGTRCRNMFPACGRMAVTPVWMESPSSTVVCPTSTPPTSVMALLVPGWKIPGATPSWRARTGVCVCARSAVEASARNTPARTNPRAVNILGLLDGCGAAVRATRIQCTLQ